MGGRSASVIFASILWGSPSAAQYRHDPAGDEVARLRAHFAAVDADLAGREGPQAELRAHLRAYAEAGVFPRNRDFPDAPTPYFVDADGTHCAMAHLLAVTGEEALVARVAATDNHAYVPDLAMDPAFGAWLDAYELAADDAARIQPAYPEHATDCVCGHEWDRGSGSGARVVAVFKGEVVSVDGDLRAPVEVRILALLGGWRAGLTPGAILDLPMQSYGYGGGGPVVSAAEGEHGVFAIDSEGWFWRVPLREPCPERRVYPDTPRADAESLTIALLAPDCRAALVRHDPRWDHGWTRGQDESGCAAAPTPLLWALAALSSAGLSARGRRRRGGPRT